MTVVKKRSKFTAEQPNWENATNKMNVGEITEKNIVQFKCYLKSHSGQKSGTTMAANTIRKYLRTIRPLLAMASPNDTCNRHGLGLIDEMQELAPPQEILRDAVDTFTREEIVVWIKAAKSRRARPDSGVPSSLW
jgi:hypothetical protein